VHAIILAGGFGTRLNSLVADRPKPMAEVAGRPFLEYLLLQLRRYGCHDVLLCIGHLGQAVRDYFDSGERWQMAIDYSAEPDARGTAGALKLAEPRLHGETFLVLNGDSLFDISFAPLIEAHSATGALVTLALAQLDDAARYGSVTLDEAGRVTAFVEKGTGQGPALINAGVYVVDRGLLDLIVPNRPASLEREIFPALVNRGLYGLPLDGSFVDIGIPADLLALRDSPRRLLNLIS
jgi:mannose-1-phosphate guanylyltransferase